MRLLESPWCLIQTPGYSDPVRGLQRKRGRYKADVALDGPGLGSAAEMSNGRR